jgi:hypothetical protein
MQFEFLDLDYELCPLDQMPDRFGFECPKNPGHMCTGLLIRVAGGPRPSWEWNGNREKPTFRPSINCEGCSHGYITDGVWKYA